MSDAHWFVVTGELKLTHVVEVGIRAADEAAAQEQILCRLESGRILDCPTETPVLAYRLVRANGESQELIRWSSIEEAIRKGSHYRAESCLTERSVALAQTLAAVSVGDLDLIDAQQRLADLVDEARALLGIEPGSDDETQTDLFEASPPVERPGPDGTRPAEPIG